MRVSVPASAALALVVALTACGEPPVTQAAPRSASEAEKNDCPPEYAGDDGTWGRFHSKRFQLSVPLPEGKTWKIDDHSKPNLVAVHAATSSELAITATQEEDLVNRQRCETRARNLGWVPKSALTTVEDQVHIGPEAYDSRVWVALEAGRPGGSVAGHVFLFGAFIRRCLIVRLTTSVPSPKDEEVLAARLALATSRIIKGIAIDPPRTTDDATVPRDKPDTRR